MSELALVTGAAGGQQGSTGRKVTESLLQRGVAVRAFVHTDDERAAALRELGAQVVAGDLREIRDVEPALDGVDRVFFTYPVSDGLLTATSVMAAAAKEAGIRRLVEVSQLWPDTNSITPRTRQHWVSEKIFDAAGVGAVHLRATGFYENYSGIAKLARNGEFAMPFGPAHQVVPLVAAADVARIATVLLADLALPAEPYYQLVGAVRTVEEMAADMARLMGAPLRYVEVDEVQWRENAIAEGMDVELAHHLSRFGRAFADRIRKHGEPRITPSIQKVTGAPPVTLEDYLHPTTTSPVT